MEGEPAAPPSPVVTPQKLPSGATYEGVQVDVALLEVKRGVKPEYSDTKMITALVRICNKSVDEIWISSSSWTLLGNNDGRYSTSLSIVSTNLEPRFPEGERLLNGDCARGWIGWDTPAEAVTAIRYRPDSEPGGTWTL